MVLARVDAAMPALLSRLSGAARSRPRPADRSVS